MINFNAYVIELEEDTWYKVCIEDVMKTTVRDNGCFDDTVITLKPNGVYLRKAVVVVNMLFRLITAIDI